jgi:hypothetical protein
MIKRFILSIVLLGLTLGAFPQGKKKYIIVTLNLNQQELFDGCTLSKKNFTKPLSLGLHIDTVKRGEKVQHKMYKAILADSVTYGDFRIAGFTTSYNFPGTECYYYHHNSWFFDNDIDLMRRWGTGGKLPLNVIISYNMGLSRINFVFRCIVVE